MGERKGAVLVLGRQRGKRSDFVKGEKDRRYRHRQTGRDGTIKAKKGNAMMKKLGERGLIFRR